MSMMNRISVLVCLLIMGVAQLSYAQAPAKKDGAVFKFAEGETHDFGEIPEGPHVSYEFKYTNTGNQPLIIMDAKGSCSCTTVDGWIKEPVLPGQTGWIKVGYNTKDKPGPFTKEVYIQSTALVPDGGKRFTLHIKGTVK
jgi:Protein of unknown function (DUF1573)